MKTNTEQHQKFIDLLPELWMNATRPEQEISLRIYQYLAKNVHPNERILAAELPYSEKEIQNILEPLKAGIYRKNGDIIGFIGLTTQPMAHSIKVNGITTYTWCALDALFIPELLGKEALVKSVDPITKKSIEFTYGYDQLATKQSEVVVSLLEPNADKLTQEIIGNFCHFVYFFESRESGNTWIESHPDTYLVTLSEAFEIGQLMNRTRYKSFIGDN